ncbi:hypothetical protein [Rivularia sp. UHCC 0363]|uniref:hypothetical protein n=1 Tax=Rivularia sp. UHCC 0363 TaxID=3110244 RepID=UPI002B220767|nr:hypothetical protein [Rivularia sp. UHCC 0363]MEA5598349.1 hypothetical protein [Rivularia sp. UHCC 0363]
MIFFSKSTGYASSILEVEDCHQYNISEIQHRNLGLIVKLLREHLFHKQMVTFCNYKISFGCNSLELITSKFVNLRSQ